MLRILLVYPLQSFVVDDTGRILRTFEIIFTKHRMLDVLLHHLSHHSGIAQRFAISIQEIWIIQVGLELANVAIEFIYATLIRSRSRTLVASSPLTKHSCTIAFVFEHLWQYLMLWVVRFLTNYRILFVFSILHHWHSAPIFFVASNVGMTSMLTCHDGSSRWG